jgi:shikimate kinase
MVGRYLAKFTMRAFFDTDEIVESKAGKSIQSIFSEDGESAFRDLESATLREVSGELGCVIATGGGVVEREVNRGFLAQNCIVVFLDRALDELPKDGRPLSLLKGVEELYDERMPRYVDWSDYRIKACNGIIETVQAVIEMLEL